MNGIGKDTEIKDTGLLVVDVVRTLLIVFGALFVLSLVMWITRKAQIQKELCVCAGCGICRKEK